MKAHNGSDADLIDMEVPVDKQLLQQVSALCAGTIFTVEDLVVAMLQWIAEHPDETKDCLTGTEALIKAHMHSGDDHSVLPLRTWDEFEKEIFTPEELAESDKRVAEIGKMLSARRSTTDS